MKKQEFIASVGVLTMTLTLALSFPRGAVNTAQAAPQGDTLKKAQQARDRGLDYLRKIQASDGSWNHYPGTTALAVAAFLRNGRKEGNEPAIAKGIQYLMRQVKPNGAIYSDANPGTALPNYNTALAMMALSLTRNPAYKPTLARAQKYLERSQFDEEESISPSDPMYGGVGYGSKADRPDLSNLHIALQALKESGTPDSSPVWQKAITFIQRVQNRAETNDQAWAKEGPNDGGFIYDSKGRSENKSRPYASMGAMTYAGIKSYIYCGVTRNDPRVQSAWDWIRRNYTVTEHPGMGEQSLYYYYHTMAKTLDVYGQKIVRDGAGKAHDWATDLAGQLVAAQKPDGSWVNSAARFWEDQPALVSSYSLIALSYCLKK